MGFLDGLFEKKSAANDRATGHAISGSPNAMAYGYASGGDWDTDKAVKAGYEKVLWVFRCVDAIASNQVTIPIYEQRGAQKQQQGHLKNHNPKLHHLLNVRANSYEDAAMFRYRLTSLALLSRRGVFIEVVGNPNNPEALHLIPPGSCEPIPDPKTFVSGYRVRTANGSVEELKPSQVIWIRVKPHPTDPYAQMTPLVAAGITAETDYFARLFNRNFLMNDGRPGLLITVDGPISPEDAQELKRRFSGGASTAGQASVIEAEGLNVADLSATPRDAQWQEVTRVSKEDLLLAFGVPESILGNASGRCVDDQTEAFTKRGWVNGYDLTTDDVILSCDPADGRMKWSPIHEVYRNHNYAGDMYRLKHSHADFLVTPGHNWLTTDGELVKVEDLNTHSRLVLMGDAEDSTDKAIYDDALVELVGWYATEGYNGGKKTPYLRIRQNDGPNSVRIEDALQRADAAYSTHRDEKKWLFNIRGDVARQIDQIAPEKIISYDFIRDLTADQRMLLMNTMVDGDGCRQGSTKSLTFAQKDKRASEAFVYLATLCGYSTSLRERSYTYRHKGVEQQKSDWIVIVRHRKVTTTQRNTVSMEKYNGFVWCPRTDYGTFVARRNGRVMVTGNTFDNADAEYEIFWTHTMKPHCEALARGLDPLTGSIGDSTKVAFDYSTVDVLQRQERRQHDKAFAEWQAGATSLDEYRMATGKDPINVPGSRIIVLPSGIAIAHSPEDQAAVTKLPNVYAAMQQAGQQGAGGAGGADGAAGATGGPLGARPPRPGGVSGQGLPAGATAGMRAIESGAAHAGAMAGVQAGLHNLDNQMSARALRLAGKNFIPSRQIEKKALHNSAGAGSTGSGTDGQVIDVLGYEVKEHPYADQRRTLEGQLQGVMLSWGNRQAKVCVDRLGHSKVRKGTRHWDGEESKAFRGLDAFYVVEVDKWVDEVQSDFRVILTDAMKKEALRVARDMQDTGVLADMLTAGKGNPKGVSPLDKVMGSRQQKEAMLEQVMQSVLDVVEASTRRQSHRIAEKIQQMDQAGASLAEIREQTRRMVADQSTWHKALTTNMTTAAYEGVKHEVYATAGNLLEKVWNCLEDERVRFSHKEVDGDTRRVGVPFIVGKSAMMYPGDPEGPAEEVANCRCFLTFQTTQ